MAHENTSGEIPKRGSIQKPWPLPTAISDKRECLVFITEDGEVFDNAGYASGVSETLPGFFKNFETGALYFVNDDRSVWQILPGDVVASAAKEALTAASAVPEPVLTRDWPHGYEVGGWASDDMSWQDVRVLCWDRPGRAPVVVMTNDGTMLWLDENGSAPSLQLRCKPAPKRSGTVYIDIVETSDGSRKLLADASLTPFTKRCWKTIARLEIPWIEGQGLGAET